MMKKLSLAICYIFFSVIVIAQKTFTGKVTDAQSGLPVPAATIEIKNTGTFLTDDNGMFRVVINKTPQVIKISSAGFKTLETVIEPSAGVTGYKLERFNLFLQPVEIRAIRANDKAPFTKTNLTKIAIENSNLGQDLPFLLNQTPSVVISSDAGNGVGYTGIRIRGSDPTRINVTLNGIPYNDAESQGSYFVDLPDLASSVNSIQIQRGVGTSSNGGGAFGATINIATNEFREQAYAEFNNSYGSFHTRKHTLKGGTGLLNDHFTVDARVSKIASNGFIDRASSNLTSLYLSAAYLNKKSSLRFNIISGKEKTYQAWYGILQSSLAKSRTYNSAGTAKPGEPYENETDNYRQDNYQLFYNHEFGEHVSFNTAVFLTRGKGYYEQYKAQQALSGFGLPNTITGSDTIRVSDVVQQLWLDNYFYGNIFSLQYKRNGSNLTFGGGINRYDGKHYGKLVWAKVNIPDHHKWYDLDAVKSDINIYTKLQHSIAQSWEGFIDLQYRRVDYDINGFRNNPGLNINNTYDFFNPKAGIYYNNRDWNGYLSYSVGRKEPNRDDFEAGLVEQPRPERLHDFELGVGKKAGSLTLNATLYYMLYKDQLVLTGKINDVGAYTRTNIPRSFRKGIELAGEYRIKNWFIFNGNLTLSSNKVVDFTEFVDDYDLGGQKIFRYSKTDISFSPGLTAGSTVTLIPVKNGEINLIGKYVGRQYLDNTGNRQRSLGDFYVQDIRLVYQLSHKIIKNTKCILQVNNLFNRKYEPSGYTFSYLSNGGLQTENYVYPMAGTNWMAGVNIRL